MATRVTASQSGNNDCRGCAVLAPSGSFWVLLGPSGSFWLHVLRAKWVERNADGWERSNNATRVCGADRAVELVEHTTWSGHVQYGVVGVLHGL